MKRLWVGLGFAAAIIGPLTMPASAQAQEYRRRADLLCQIQKDKFDRVLPSAMRENGIDMWIIAMREGGEDPNYELMGGGYIPLQGYYIFTDRGGERIERATLRIMGKALERCGAYDIVASREDLKTFVEQRNPKRIGIDIATEIGPADGLSHSMYENLVAKLGPDLSSRLVSAEKLNADYRSRQPASEIRAYAQAGAYAAEIADRAFSNEVIKPGKTTVRDVSDWMMDQLLVKGLGSSFGPASVWIQRPGTDKISDDTVIQPGDFLGVDWGVVYLNKWTDMKRTAYVLKPGETKVPAGIQQAFDNALRVREMIMKEMKPGGTGDAMLNHLYDKVDAMPGYITARNPAKDRGEFTDVVIGCHAVGDFGHGSGASAITYPLRRTYVLEPSHALSIEFFASTPVPEWQGKRVSIALEDDAVLTPSGVEFVYSPIRSIALIK